MASTNRSDESSANSPKGEIQIHSHSGLCYQVYEENGVSYFGPPINWSLGTPERGSEIFIRKIPPAMTALELFQLFQRAGVIYKLRLMMQFSGLGRGFGFIIFQDRDTARRAIQLYNGYSVRPTHRLEVALSRDTRTLCLLNVPRWMSHEAICKFLGEIQTPTIKYLRSMVIENHKMAYLEFEDNRSSYLARKQIHAKLLSINSEMEITTLDLPYN